MNESFHYEKFLGRPGIELITLSMVSQVTHVVTTSAIWDLLFLLTKTKVHRRVYGSLIF